VHGTVMTLCLYTWCSGLAFGQGPQRIRFASVVSKVEPIYPTVAQKQAIQGAVWLDAVIGKDGHVLSTQPISGNPILVDSAKDAVLQWVYRPTLLNGEPIDVLLKVCVPFVLRQSKATPCASADLPTTRQTARPSFAMTIGLKANTVKPGSEVSIDVELRDVSGKEIQLVRVRTGPPLYSFKVLDQNGRPAPLTPLGEAIASGKNCYQGKNGEMRCLVGSASFDAVAPGKRLPDVFRLSDYVDLNQPSRYTVRLQRTDPYSKLQVNSNTIVIIVENPE
jgi:Gram-negative bacterial TonB protein C-terminal